MDKTEKLRAAWSLYFSNNNINPIKTEDLSSDCNYSPSKCADKR